MNDHPSPPPPARQEAEADLAAGLAAIDRDCPSWHAWEGVIAGLLYARRPKSSPPRVVRATTLDGLREAIAADEREWAQRR